MRRATLLFSIVAWTVFAPSPASAHIDDLDFSLASGSSGQSGIRWDTVSGSITCDEGERYRIVVKVLDSPSFEGKGSTKGTCTGDPQQWRVVLTDSSGSGDGGPCIVITAHTKTPEGEPHDRAQVTDGC